MDIQNPEPENDDDKFKRLQEIFVPYGDDGVWQVTHDACRCCDQRFIEISGKGGFDKKSLFKRLQQVLNEQMMPDFVGNEEIEFRLVVVARPRP